MAKWAADFSYLGEMSFWFRLPVPLQGTADRTTGTPGSPKRRRRFEHPGAKIRSTFGANRCQEFPLCESRDPVLLAKRGF